VEVRPAFRLWVALEVDRQGSTDNCLPGPIELWEPYLRDTDWHRDWWFDNGFAVAQDPVDLDAHYRAWEALCQDEGIPTNAHHLLNPDGELLIYSDEDMAAGYGFGPDLDPRKLAEALQGFRSMGKIIMPITSIITARLI
jgi:hypothetical protein